ncbi:MAG: peptidoglycan DD-metalloendopeptidase family protein [Deltaproteobacteria bacterium]|nr:peptidoglycan DD-metalloendopeptidase family protein [Deltaproteobacteria bacterium]
MKRAFFPTAVLLCVAGCIFAGALNAAEKRALVKEEKKLEDVKKKLKEARGSISRISEKEAGVLGELESVNIRLVKNRAMLRKAGADLKAVTEEVTSADRNMRRLKGETNDLNLRLQGRLRAMYMMLSGGMERAVFSALYNGASLSDAARRYRYLAAIMDSDRRLIEDTERKLGELGRERLRLSRLQTRRAEAREAARREEKEVEKTLLDRKVLLASIRKEKDRYLSMERELEEAQKGMLDLIEKLRKEEYEGGEDSSTGFGAMRGRLPMPVEGKIVSRYGKVTHPKFNTVTFNNGIIIEAPLGAKVKNVYDGKVIYVGWLKGYGQVLIIDHGKGFYTLFAQLSEVLKKRGDAVEKGEYVGLVGDTGAHDAPGLYFEVRQKGVPRDPLAWLGNYNPRR